MKNLKLKLGLLSQKQTNCLSQTLEMSNAQKINNSDNKETNVKVKKRESYMDNYIDFLSRSDISQLSWARCQNVKERRCVRPINKSDVVMASRQPFEFTSEEHPINIPHYYDSALHAFKLYTSVPQQDQENKAARQPPPKEVKKTVIKYSNVCYPYSSMPAPRPVKGRP